MKVFHQITYVVGGFDLLDHILFSLFEEFDVDEVYISGSYSAKRIKSHCRNKSVQNNRDDHIK